MGQIVEDIELLSSLAVAHTPELVADLSGREPIVMVGWLTISAILSRNPGLSGSFVEIILGWCEVSKLPEGVVLLGSLSVSSSPPLS